jgi:hypothetical protein
LRAPFFERAVAVLPVEQLHHEAAHTRDVAEWNVLENSVRLHVPVRPLLKVLSHIFYEITAVEPALFEELSPDLIS